MTGGQARPARRGFSLFEHGFRCFFLSAAVHAAASIALWSLAWEGVLDVPRTLPPSLWHAHEMVFGFGVAALAGFMLTAVPSWSGERPLRGSRLVALWLVWLGGRVAAWSGAGTPPAVFAAADLLFVPCLALAVTAGILKRDRKRNAVLLVVLAALLAANLAVHIEALGIRSGTADWGVRLAIGVFALLIAVIGGRIVPAFTVGGMRLAGRPVEIEPLGALDKAAILSVAAVIVAGAVLESGPVPGALAALASALGLARLVRWKGWAAWGVPLVAVLHLGYLWLVLGLALLAGAHFGLLSEMVAIHALGAGAMGTMIAAVMTRASLGHTGRALEADAPTVAIYALVTAGALLRVGGALVADETAISIVVASGAAWAAGFALFALRYGPMLLARRPDGRDG